MVIKKIHLLSLVVVCVLGFVLVSVVVLGSVCRGFVMLFNVV